MSKTTTLYLSMIVVFVAGLWGVVHLGKSLRAPHDISGTWAPVDDSDATTAAPKLAVAQSGKFVKLKVGGGASIDMILQSQIDVGDARQLTFKGGAQEMTVRTAPPATAPDEAARPYQFTLRGPVSGTYAVTRETVAVTTSASH